MQRHLRWIAVALCAWSCTDSTDRASPARQAITSGEVTSDHPSVVALIEGEPYCTGAAIGDRVVLTAAHCLYEEPLPDIALGPEVGFDSDRYLGADMRIHPGYDPGTLANDVALVLTQRAMPIEPLAVFEDVMDTEMIGSEVIVVGYGETGDVPDGRKRAGAAAISDLGDALLYLSPEPAQPCHGDSGGPILSSDGQRVIGVVSFGDAHCEEYAAATRIDTYWNFIQRAVRDYGPGGADIGEACYYAEQCRRGLCMPTESETDPVERRCQFACDGKLECDKDEDTAPARNGGCGTGSEPPSDGQLWPVFLLALAFLARRWQRRPRS